MGGGGDGIQQRQFAQTGAASAEASDTRFFPRTWRIFKLVCWDVLDNMHPLRTAWYGHARLLAWKQCVACLCYHLALAMCAASGMLVQHAPTGIMCLWIAMVIMIMIHHPAPQLQTDGSHAYGGVDNLNIIQGGWWHSAVHLQPPSRPSWGMW